jgi:hypothetical protein
MESFPNHPGRLAFDQFELDLRSGELWKNGHRIRLQPQPFQLLTMLLERQGEVATREEICSFHVNLDQLRQRSPGSDEVVQGDCQYLDNFTASHYGTSSVGFNAAL